ncbi:hypothetical protein TNCV_4655821 [Trichonephila clavipes]|nr:hypothetical protein TNCV_4655821 [Trichonephila clavipes]
MIGHNVLSSRSAKRHLQLDNTRPHVVLSFVNAQGIRMLPWPAWSSDLFPILTHFRNNANVPDNSPSWQP